MNPALETLLLAFSGENPLPVPSRALFLGAEAHPAFREWPELSGWQPFKPAAAAWDKAGLSRVDEVPAGKWPMVLLLPGKSRDETLLWFAIAREHLEPGGTILAAMPNTAGAARFEKELAKATGTITSLQKHKCRAFHATENGGWDESVFAEWLALGGRRGIPGTSFVTEAGIFSSEHVDAGSLLLADHVPAHLQGKVADLGAGWGYLSAAIHRRCPKVKEIHLFEADARALACAMENIRQLREASSEPALASPVCYAEEIEAEGTLAFPSLDFHFHWHDVTTGLPDGPYDAIVMNPPFHTGQATDVDLGRAFIRVAADSLRRGGKLIMVANRQLPYEAVLESCNLAWRKIAEDKTFKILSADKR